MPRLRRPSGADVKLRRIPPDGGSETLTVPAHGELDTGTCHAIFRQASRFIAEEELRALLLRLKRLPQRPIMRVRLDGVEDLHVPRAPAKVTRERLSNLVAARARVALEEGQRSQQHPRGAEPALDGAVPDERLLERVEPAFALEAADGADRSPAHRGRQHEAARHRPAVEQHRARAADALAAALLDVEDPERVTQHLEQRLAGPHIHLARSPVDHYRRGPRRPPPPAPPGGLRRRSRRPGGGLPRGRGPPPSNGAAPRAARPPPRPPPAGGARPPGAPPPGRAPPPHPR